MFMAYMFFNVSYDVNQQLIGSGNETDAKSFRARFFIPHAIAKIPTDYDVVFASLKTLTF